jgi:hypothetical protein
VKSAAQHALERTLQAGAPALLKRLQDDPENGQMLHEWGLENGNYGGVAILHNIAVADFADLADRRKNERQAYGRAKRTAPAGLWYGA